MQLVPRNEILLALVTLLVAGCGSGLAPLAGTVKVGGKPLTGGSGAVIFTPAAGGPSSTGSLKADGTYSLVTGTVAGIAPGEYVVSVMASTPVQLGNRDHEEIPKPLIPLRYADPKTSNLKYTIKSGQGTQDIDLEDK